MTICHKRRLIFFHLPKNAGTSIIRAMAMDDEERIFMDASIEEYKEHYKDYWDKYKKFTVIRDPIDRFISAYKFARMKESGWFSVSGENGLEKHDHYDICSSMDINEYTSYIYENPRSYNRWNYHQTIQLSNKNNEIEIDYFVRFENLQEDLKKIGIENIYKCNPSKIEDDRLIQLTKISKMKLYEIYDMDYINFGYKKEPLFDYS